MLVIITDMQIATSAGQDEAGPTNLEAQTERVQDRFTTVTHLLQ